MTVLAFALRNWKLLLTGAAIGLLGVLLLFAKADARSWHKKYDQTLSLYQVEQAKHAVTRASLDTALSAIDDQNAAVQALATESASRINAADKARIAAQEAARASLDTARALDASAAVARSKDGPCVPSETFLKHSGEL